MERRKRTSTRKLRRMEGNAGTMSPRAVVKISVYDKRSFFERGDTFG